MKGGAAFLMMCSLLHADTVFQYRFEPGALLSDKTGTHPLTATSGVSAQSNTLFPTLLPRTGYANQGVAAFNGSGHLSAPDAASFTQREFSVELYFRADTLNPAVADTLISHYSFDGINDRSWFVHEQNGRLAVTLSEDGNERYSFVSGLVIQTGVPYAALLRVRIDAQTGAEVQWSWRVLDGESSHVSGGVQTEAGLTGIHNSSARLRIGAVTKAGEADNFWDGLIDEVRLHNVWIEEASWLDREGVMEFEAYMSLFFPGITDSAVVGPEADPDGDGIRNDREYVWGTPPNNASNSGKLRLVQEAGGGFTLQFRKLKHLSPGRIHVRYRMDLSQQGERFQVEPVVVPSEPDTPPGHEEVTVFVELLSSG